MNRKIYYWKLRDAEMQLGERTLIMGVLNVTPDSFSDGGKFNDPDRAFARALELEEQGADIIDIGAESTKPGARRITADEEWQRLVPVLKRLKGNLRAALSIDTYKSEIAERALQYGVEIFNDPSGLTFDPQLAKVAATGNAGLILNHMRGQPDTWAKLPPMQDPVGTIARELEAMASRARHAGVERGRIVIDPGLGFGKRKEQNAEILAHLKQLAALDYPILVGPSRKSFLAQSSENETLFATSAAVAAAVMNGAHIVRVHDVREMQAVVRVAEEIARAAAPKTIPPAEEKLVVRAYTRTGPNFEAERPRPPRPPVSRPMVQDPPPPQFPDAAQAEDAAETPPAIQETAEPLIPKTPRVFAKPRDNGRENRRESGPARPPYPDRDKPDRDKRDGSRPPVSRPFAPRRPEQSGSAPPRSAPPRGRDFRPGQGAAAGKERFNPRGAAGPKRPYVRDGDRRDERQPRSAPPRDREDGDRSRPAGFKPPGFKPKRSFERGDESRESRPPGRPARNSGPPRSGPPRSEPPRSGPPRSGPPRADRPARRPEGPPKRPFRKRP
jgi:dihydropteroate synthase